MPDRGSPSQPRSAGRTDELIWPEDGEPRGRIPANGVPGHVGKRQAPLRRDEPEEASLPGRIQSGRRRCDHPCFRAAWLTAQMSYS